MLFKSGQAIVLVATLFLLPTLAEAEFKLSEVIEQSLPEFELQGVDGTSWNNEKLDGKPWIINFWASWCPPCIAELPSMNELWATLESEGVGMLAINAGETEKAVIAFLDKAAIDFPVVFSSGPETLSHWSVRGLPTTLIVDSEGKVIYTAVGPREWNDPELIERVLSLR